MTEHTVQILGAVMVLAGALVYAASSTPIKHMIWPKPFEVIAEIYGEKPKLRRQITLDGFAANIEPDKTITGIRIGYEKDRNQEETKDFTVSGGNIIVHNPTDRFVTLIKDWGKSEERMVLCIDFDWEISPGNVTNGLQIMISAGAEDRAKIQGGLN